MIMNTVRILVALSLLLGLQNQVMADIYKYVDKYGRVILTDKPQHDGYKKLVKTWKGWVEGSSSNSSWYKSGQWKINQKKYDPKIKSAAKRHNLPHTLIHAVITAESSYNPNAVSKAGAVGLMQLMPATAQRFGVTDRRDPLESINGGSRYLRILLDMFDNNLTLAVAAYNAGENAVKKYGNKVPPYKETQGYVKKVLEYYQKYKKTMT